MKMKTARARIIKSSDNFTWYKDKVGEIVEIVPNVFMYQYYLIANTTIVKGVYISDVEILPDPLEKMNMIPKDLFEI